MLSGCFARRLKTTTVRKVKKESNTGSVESRRLRLQLTIEVESVDFDPEACVMRCSGKNIAENEHVRLGAHHTLEMEQHRPFSLHKNQWDVIALDRIEAACDPATTADLAAVVMQEGLAHICLVTGSMTLLRSKVEKAVPKKRQGPSSHDKGLERFFDLVVESVLIAMPRVSIALRI